MTTRHTDGFNPGALVTQKQGPIGVKSGAGAGRIVYRIDEDLVKVHWDHLAPNAHTVHQIDRLELIKGVYPAKSEPDTILASRPPLYTKASGQSPEQATEPTPPAKRRYQFTYESTTRVEFTVKVKAETKREAEALMVNLTPRHINMALTEIIEL